MITMPQFLRELIESDAYANRQNPDYQITNEKVEYYMRMLYPGEMEIDATGKFVAPEFDMTLGQFVEAQSQIDADFEEEKQEAEAEIMDEFGEYFNNLGISFDIDSCVEPGELIPVKVLYPGDVIILRNLETYDLEIPEFDKVQKIWIWHGEIGDTSCDECESLAGQVFYDEDELPECPVHPNCRCWVEECEIDEDGNIISRARVAGNPSTSANESLPPLTEEPLRTDEEVATENTNNENEGTDMTEEERFQAAYENLREPEGGYTDGTNQINDQPTNMGITQGTLNAYRQNNPDSGFPTDVINLQPHQAREIYRNEYWDNTRIPEIVNDRIRNAAFDMGVMSGQRTPTRTIQTALNEHLGTNLTIDGRMGTNTINAINSIPANEVERFMNILIDERMNSLRTMRNWPTARGGWTRRTMAY